MWGDPERAHSLDSSDPLAGYLLQISGPSHVPLKDARWQEILLHFGVWIHIDVFANNACSVSTPTGNNNTSNLWQDQFLPSMTKHAAQSSNLAALTMHTSRMIRELTEAATHEENADATMRIQLVGKARATCGTMNLLRIFLSGLVSSPSLNKSSTDNDGDEEDDTNESPAVDENGMYASPCSSSLREALIYTSREASTPTTPSGARSGSSRWGRSFSQPQPQPPLQRDTSAEILSALLEFLSDIPEKARKRRRSTITNSTLSGQQQRQQQPLMMIPELYDALVVAMELLLVLLSTQLYQPMISSLQQREQQHKEQNSRKKKRRSRSAPSPPVIAYNTMLSTLMDQGRERRLRSSSGVGDVNSGKASNNGNSSSVTSLTMDWTPRSLLQSLLDWQMTRPHAPERSVARHLCDLSQSVAAAKGDVFKVGPDGMYETHLIVMAERPPEPNKQDGNGLHPADGTGVGSSGSRAMARRRSSSRDILIDATKGALVLSSNLLFLPFRLMRLALVLLGASGGKGANSNSTIGKGGGSLQLYDKSRRTNDVLWLSDSPVGDLATSLLLLLLHNYRNNNQDEEEEGSVSLVPDEAVNPFRLELAALNDNRWDDPAAEILLSQQEQQTAAAEFLAGVNTAPQELSKETAKLQSVPLLNSEEPATVSDNGLGNGGSNMLVTSGANGAAPSLVAALPSPSSSSTLTVNFEKLFDRFGSTIHNELGALWLYTMMQASPVFATSISVRSDLDTLVVPLLRTLYFSSSLKYHGGDVRKQSMTDGSFSIKSCPFRSSSQLYLILILLLLLSQDPSFGPDAFRRSTNVGPVKWYKERYLRRDVSLGSLIILVMLRSLTLNLNRLHDAFLLSNCCAVLMNLSPHVVKLHDYAAMRLVSVTISCMKKYVSLRISSTKAVTEDKSPNRAEGVDHNAEVDDEDDLTTPLGMYGEVTRTLLSVLKHCVSSKNLDKNVHVVYALVYHQVDWFRVIATAARNNQASGLLGAKNKMMKRLERVIRTADRIIQDHGDARTAPKALQALKENMEVLITEAGNDGGKSNNDHGSPALSADHAGDFTFSYEEETDPEVFFVPYIWECVVCCVTSTLMDWNVDRIQVFDLMDEEEEEDPAVGGNHHDTASPEESAWDEQHHHGSFSKNADEMV